MKNIYIVISAALSVLLFFFFTQQFSPEQRYTLFFLNKAAASTAVTLIALSYLWGPIIKIVPFLRPHKMLRKYLGIFGFGAVLLHMQTSLMQFESRLKLDWYFSHAIGFAGGLLATAIFLKMTLTSGDAAYLKLGKEKWQFIQRLGYIAMILTAIHIFFAAQNRWLMWSRGEVAMPMSMKVAILIGVVFLFRGLAFILDKKFPKQKK